MKRLCIFTILAAAALTACVKENAPAPVSEIEDTVDEVISFDFSVRPMAETADTNADAGTKALVSASGLLSSGNQIKVYDVFKGTTSTAEYFNTTLTSDGSAWGTEDEYKWTRTGTHNFFGWFLKDASGNNTNFASLFGSASYSDYTLTLPAIEMTASTPQFDFLYSDVIQKNRSNGSSDPTGPISLKMKHLFTAFSLGARNEGSEKVTITKVEISGLANKKSAIISFDVANGGDTNVELTTSSDAHSTNPDFNFSGSIELTSSATKNNILSTEDSANYLMWPQTTTDLENATISVEYTQNGLNKSASFNIPNAQAWVPGTLNHITVVFTNQSVKLDRPTVTFKEVLKNTLTFTWSAVSNATGYEVSTNGTSWTSVGNTTTHTLSNLSKNTSYTLYVRATSSDSSYETSDSGSASGKTAIWWWEGSKSQISSADISDFNRELIENAPDNTIFRISYSSEVDDIITFRTAWYNYVTEFNISSNGNTYDFIFKSSYKGIFVDEWNQFKGFTFSASDWRTRITRIQIIYP